MKKLCSISAILLFITTASANAQTAFTTQDSVNNNNINAAVLVHGDMWWDPVAQVPHCSYPNGSGKNIAITGALWMSGYDAGTNLHIAAQTYRQHGNDYWPGPLDASDTLTYATSQKWAKIWKLNRSDIQIFQALSATGAATQSNTAAAIWSWPAKGNVYAKGNSDVALTITDDMAPFVDVNANGIYEPQLGDYPDVKGDQALWWVFSDNGAAHSETHGKPLKVEVHAMAYAYRRGNAIDNVIYYQYTIKNKSANTYQNFRVGQLADMDLGTFDDDYIGFDSNRAMGIIYNADTIDATYGKSMPMAGLIMRAPSPVGSFIYYNNDNSVTGNPLNEIEYNYYLRSQFRDGVHIVNDFTAYGVHTSGRGTGTPTNYVYPGDPGNHSEWSECSSSNAASDRRFVIASGDATFNAGSSINVTMMLVATPPALNNACGDTGLSFANIQHIADTAIAVFDAGGLPPLPLGTPNIIPAKNVNIYPNPGHDKLYIENTAQDMSNTTVKIYNMMGQLIAVPINKNGQKCVLDISMLPSGLYNLLYRNGAAQTSVKFTKE